MINFDEIHYERLDYEKTKIRINNLINSLKKSSKVIDYIKIIKEIIEIQNHIEEMCDYADIRNMRNCDDEFYKNEMDYWNSYKIKYDSLFLPFYSELNNSIFKNQLKEYMPSNFFRIIDNQSRITKDDLSSLTKRENDLKMEYRNLNKTKINYDGEERTIGYIGGFFSNKDRNLRKQAHDAINDFYYSNQTKYDKILYELINIRNKIANQLGFDNYVIYSLYKLKRFDYTYDDIDRFRNNVNKYITPLCKLMSQWQKEELKLDELKYYDTVFFTEMPEIKMKGKELLNQFKESFKLVDSDLLDLYNIMINSNFIDLEQRDNKVNFSITNYLTETNMPVVTGNFKNSYLDVQTTTHEMGHAFQKYCASIKDKDFIVSSLLKYPTMEVAEMFSYSMELIMMKYVDNIFNEEDYKKYCFMKMYNMISSLPYMCLVDEFQEKLYSKRDLKIEDIRKTWIELSNKYGLKRANSGHINLETGGYFYRQSHIFLDPFYYIDYALSYFGAFSIWNQCEKDLNAFKEQASVASYYSFKELISIYNLPNPFDEKVFEDISLKLKNELESKRVVN